MVRFGFDIVSLLPSDVEMRKFTKHRTGNAICCGIALLHFAWILPTLLSHAFVSDETAFLLTAYRSASSPQWVTRVLSHPNEFGYGGLWWSVYLLMIHLLDLFAPILHETATRKDASTEFVDYITVAGNSSYLFWPMIGMRLLAYLSFSGAALAIALRNKNKTGSVVFLVFTLSTPIAFWSGKVASPELLAASLFLLATYFLMFENRVLGPVFLYGLAIGLKLTVAPMAVPFLAYVAIRELRQRGLAGSWRPAILTGIGFTLGNTFYLLSDTQAYFHKLASLSAFNLSPSTLWRLKVITIAHNQTWDMTTFGSLFYWSGSAVALFFLAGLAIFRSSSRPFALCVFASVLFMIAFMMTQPWHGWYFFPICVVSALAFLHLSQPIVGVLAVALHLWFSAPKIEQEIWTKRMHIAEMESEPSQRECFDGVMRALHPANTMDQAVLGVVIHPPPDTHRDNFIQSFVQVVGDNNTMRFDGSVKSGGTLLLFGPRAAYMFFSRLMLRPYAPGAGGECGMFQWRYISPN